MLKGWSSELYTCRDSETKSALVIGQFVIIRHVIKYSFIRWNAQSVKYEIYQTVRFESLPNLPGEEIREIHIGQSQLQRPRVRF
jgi:hypothetical protein